MRTIRIEGDPNLLELSEFINNILKKNGYIIIRHRGSHSWYRRQEHTNRRRIIFKLCYMGNYFVFGIREENITIKKIRKLCPLSFTVAPHPEVIFLGFEVQNNDTSRRQIKTVLYIYFGKISKD